MTLFGYIKGDYNGKRKRKGDQDKRICMGKSDLVIPIPKMQTGPFAHSHKTKQSNTKYF